MHDVTAHNAPQGAEFLFVLADFAAVRGADGLDPLDELGNFLAGTVELRVDEFVVGRQGVVIILQRFNLALKVLLLDLQFGHQGFVTASVEQQQDTEHNGQGGKNGDDDFLRLLPALAALRPFTLFALDAAEGIFSFHNAKRLNFTNVQKILNLRLLCAI